MLLQRNQPSSPPPDTAPVAGLVRTNWVLSVCVVCGHERPHGEQHRATCPTCGAQLRSFALYRDLQAGQ
jgi:rubrerythrin